MKHETSRDSVSQKIIKIIQTGWPRSKKALPEDLKEYWKHKSVVSESEGIVLKDQRILVPIAVRSTILKKLHQGHPGIEKNRNNRKKPVFWPRINKDIKERQFERAT